MQSQLRRLLEYILPKFESWLDFDGETNPTEYYF
jgi:hypothetical protein